MFLNNKYDIKKLMKFLGSTVYRVREGVEGGRIINIKNEKSGKLRRL